MKCILITLIFLCSCNLYELIGEETQISDELSFAIGSKVIKINSSTGDTYPSQSLYTFTPLGSSSSETFIITNNSNSDVYISYINLGGDPKFSIATISCLVTLAPNASCSETINFDGMSGGSFNGNFEVDFSYNGITKNYNLNLYGEGT